MPVPSAILTTLSPEDLAGLEAFARERVRSIDDCHEWLQAHGYTQISRSSVGRWKKSFHMNDRFAAASDLARELMEAKKNAGGAGGSVDIADGANLKLHQLLFDKLLEIETRAATAAKARARGSTPASCSTWPTRCGAGRRPSSRSRT
jgi:hypothetical protein